MIHRHGMTKSLQSRLDLLKADHLLERRPFLCGKFGHFRGFAYEVFTCEVQVVVVVVVVTFAGTVQMSFRLSIPDVSEVQGNRFLDLRAREIFAILAYAPSQTSYWGAIRTIFYRHLAFELSQDGFH